MQNSVQAVTNFMLEVTAGMKRPVTCRRCGKLIRQGQVMGVWILGNGVVKLQVRYQCLRCQYEGYATLPPEIWAGSKLLWDKPLSELSPEEAEQFAQLPSISVDEVLDFYDALKYIDRVPRALLEKLLSHAKTTAKVTLSPRYQKRMLRGS